MSYFSKFPYIGYEFNGNRSIVKDILRRAAFKSEYKPYADLYSPYMIVDGDSPQSLAHRFYGASTYHWVILLFNEIHNIYTEWPQETAAFEKYCIDKYGEDVMHKTMHYELDGVVVGEVKNFVKGVVWIPPVQIGLSVPVSFYEYEESVNTSLRTINILRPELLGDFVTQFEEYINV